MLSNILLVLHVIVAGLLVVAILLQAGKGSDLGAVFGGGGSQALFGAAGPMDFIKKATIVLAALFMIISLFLGYVVKTKPTRSIMTPAAKTQTTKAVPAPAGQPVMPAAPAPQQSAPVPQAAPSQSK